MTKEQTVVFLKAEIEKIEESYKDTPEKRIIITHINADLFLKLARFYVSIKE